MSKADHMAKKTLYIAIAFGFIVILGVALIMRQESEEEWRCLGEGEEAGFYDTLDRFKTSGVPKEYPLKVIVRDKGTEEEINSIVIDYVFENYRPAEVHNCSVYTLKEFNFDEKKNKMLPKPQIPQIKKQIISQIEKTFPADKKTSAINEINSMNDEQLEQFLIKNNLIKPDGSSSQQQCIFCSIIFGDIPSTKIAENEKAIAILELNPISKAHTIIIPKINSIRSPKQV